MENETMKDEMTEKETVESVTIERAPKKRSLWFIIGGMLLVVLLVGAAFVAGRLLKKPATANVNPGGGGGMVVGGDGVMKEVEIERPKELPDRAPDVTGALQKVENNSIFVTASSGPIGIMVGPEGGKIDVDTESGDATTVEVVVTQETLIYRDANAFQSFPGDGPPDKIEQKVAPMTLDELKGQALVTAWGERKGDRLIAEVVFCTIIPEMAE